jgi:alanyl-tRNA synthetase
VNTDSNDIISRFLEFFGDRGHKPVVGTSLIPPDPDDSVLYVTSGMHPLTSYLGGRPHPDGNRLCNLQRCLRTTDLDEVGDLTHLTVFGMLGSWSLGDYGGPQSQSWGLELLTEGHGIPVDRLHVTVFSGDHRCGPDRVSERQWLELGLRSEQITGLPDNWWGPNGPDGLCGPDTEMFVWTGPGSPVHDISRPEWVEVWNHVLMRYQLSSGGLVELDRPCVDTGMGLERLVMVLGGHRSVYDTDLLSPWTEHVQHRYGLTGRPLRLVSDHLRSISLIVGDGVRPSNTGCGYVLRRLIRRTFRELGDLDGVTPPGGVIEQTGRQLGMEIDSSRVGDVLEDERDRFTKLLVRGRRELDKLLRRGPVGDTETRFLFETHGIPPEITRQLLRAFGTRCPRRLRMPTT